MKQPRHLRLAGFALGLAAILASSPLRAENESGAPVRVNSDAIAELIYGVYCAAEPIRTEEAPETASGVVNIVPQIPEIRFVQTIVPAALDVGFGVLTRVPEGVVHDPVTIIVTHPPFPDSGIEVERWITRLDWEGLNLTGFSFDMPEELVTGTWTFTAQAGETELFHVTFEVVPPAMARDVLAECQMAFTS